MTVATATPLATLVTAEQAREELARFFVIADACPEFAGMFSGFIDMQWHQLAETSEYSEFCRRAVGHEFYHAAIMGEGDVRWLPLYHERFGELSAAWFADKEGVVDEVAYARYRETGTVNASWNCGPTTDPDFKPAA